MLGKRGVVSCNCSTPFLPTLFGLHGRSHNQRVYMSGDLFWTGYDFSNFTTNLLNLVTGSGGPTRTPIPYRSSFWWLKIHYDSEQCIVPIIIAPTYEGRSSEAWQSLNYWQWTKNLLTAGKRHSIKAKAPNFIHATLLAYTWLGTMQARHLGSMGGANAPPKKFLHPPRNFRGCKKFPKIMNDKESNNTQLQHHVFCRANSQFQQGKRNFTLKI